MSHLQSKDIDKPSRPERVFVAGHRGLVGSALLRVLRDEAATIILTASRDELDLRDHSIVRQWFRECRPDYVLLAAGTVGGILANMEKPADFIYDNLAIACSVIHAAAEAGVHRLVYLGSSCIYPHDCEQPMREGYLFSGRCEPTNEFYATAKLAGIKMCEAYRRQYGCDFVAVIPCNLYGPRDNYDPRSSHVIPALIRKFHEAKVREKDEVRIWGTGRPSREFLYVDDLARAVITVMRASSIETPINIGSGKEISIRDLALLIRNVIGAEGVTLSFEDSKPDGASCRVMDVERICDVGWHPLVGLREGIERTYKSFLEGLYVERPL